MATNGASDTTSKAAHELATVLSGVLSPNNEVRNKSEKSFNMAKKQPSLCLDALSLLATACEDLSIREVAVVLLRRSARELWEGANHGTRESVKQRLLAGIQADTRKDLRKKLCDTTGVIGAPLIEEGKWEELLPTLFEMARSPAHYHREAALYVFSHLFEFMDSKRIEPYLPQLHEVFQHGLGDGNLDVQLASLKTLCRVLSTVPTRFCRPFESLMLQMLLPIRRSLEEGKEDDARKSIELMIEITETEPQFFLSQLNAISELMFQVTRTKDLEDNTRHMAMEFLLSVAEKVPSVCRKHPPFAATIVPIAMSWMLEVDDDESWYSIEDADEETKGYDMFHAGEESMDRIAIALGGGLILPLVESLLPSFVNNTESWQHRHAGIITISQVGEGCQEQIEEKMEQFLFLVMKHFKDPHPRVRWAAINCTGQMCTDFGPEIQKRYHHVIIPNLLAIMADSSVPRVQAHGAAALINYCDESSPPVIHPYLDEILQRMREMMSSPLKLIHEQAITALAAVADTAGKSFKKYYKEFMPALINALRETGGSKDARKLRGKILECVSLIGLSVGRETFQPDVGPMMKVLISSSNPGDFEPDDPQFFYLMQAYARICRCLKKDFMPYVPHIVPKFLIAANQKPEIEVKDVMPEDNGDEDGFETIQLGDKRIGIRTSNLEDKATACTMIACFVHELKGGFYPYMQDVVHLMVPLLTFFYHDDVRVAAANCAGDFIPCVRDAQGDKGDPQVVQLVDLVVPKLLAALKGEPELDVLIALLDALGAYAKHAKPGMISKDLLEKSAVTLLLILQESGVRTKERWDIAEEQEWDDLQKQDVVIEEKKEADVLARCTDAVGEFLKNHRDSGFSELLDKELIKVEGSSVSLLKLYASLLLPENKDWERRSAICFFDDLISHGGEKGIAAIPEILPLLKKYSVDPKPDVSQAAIFGVGECARVGGNVFIQASGPEIIPVIETVLNDPHAWEGERAAASDNFISTLGKIMEFHPDLLPGAVGAKFGNLWLKFMPTCADTEEAAEINAALVRSVERGDMRVLGENYSNLGRIFSIFAEVFGTSKMKPEYLQRAVGILQRAEREVPAAVMQGVFSSLSEPEKQKLKTAVASASG